MFHDDERAFFDNLSAEIKRLYAEGDRIQQAVLAVGPSIQINRAGVNKRVAHTLLALLARAFKTSRAIQVAAAAGLDGNAQILCRTLLETAMAAEWIRKEESEHRAMLLTAYGLNQTKKMLRALGAKAETAAALGDVSAASAQIDSTLSSLAARLGGDKSWKDHWSGRGNFFKVCELLDTTDWYDSVYRQGSMSVHPTDQLQHMFEGDDGEIGIDFSLSDAQIPMTLGVTNFLLYGMAINVFEELGISTERMQQAKPTEPRG